MLSKSLHGACAPITIGILMEKINDSTLSYDHQLPITKMNDPLSGMENELAVTYLLLRLYLRCERKVEAREVLSVNHGAYFPPFT